MVKKYPQEMEQEEPNPGLTKSKSRLVNNYVNELEIATFGILTHKPRRWAGVATWLLRKPPDCALQEVALEFTLLFPRCNCAAFRPSRGRVCNPLKHVFSDELEKSFQVPSSGMPRCDGSS